jgi:hypothetical protein
MVNLCFTAKRANKFSTTSLKNWGPLSKIISNGVLNRVKTHSYKNRVTSCFTEDFKAHTYANFVK